MLPALVASAVAVGALLAPATTTPASSRPGPAAAPVDYADAGNWVCRPDVDDVCDSGLDATVVAADGTLTPQPFQPDPDAPIDCFYVYPTISRNATTNSDLDAADGEERYVTANQAAPLGTGCPVFAPIYRQITLTALATGLAGGEIDDDTRQLAYRDVVDAWHHYLEHDNDGRGVVLVGHSQGASILTELIADEIDGDPAVRDLLVAAYLAGTSIQVPIGRDVGGAFQNIPLCRAADQFGCVVTWSTYRASSPPPEGAFFGRGGDGTEAGCTNPAALAGGRAPLTSRFPASAEASILTDLGADETGPSWLDPAAGEITTPYVVVPDLVSGGCVRWDGFSWLELTTTPGDEPRADDIPGDLSAEWGMHLIDINVVMGDLQRLVARQGDAWLGVS